MLRHHGIRRRQRRGTILVLSAFFMVVLFALMAFSIDVGYLSVARAEMQRSADAAATAAAWQLVQEDPMDDDFGTAFQLYWKARQAAQGYTEKNRVMNKPLSLGWSDVAVGSLDNPADPSEQMDYYDPSQYNAVRVRVRKTSQRNGELPLFFARVLGHDSQSLEATATAALLRNIGGFTLPPSSDVNLGILPIAIDEQSWNAMLAGNADDDWGWDKSDGEVDHSGDGILEVNLFPQGTGSPGNRGTVDIGSSNNSTQDLRRQILEGISADDLAYHGGSLQLDESGELHLNADPGISAGIKSALQQLIGETRVIPIFRDVTGSGNNAMYTIVGFAGVRIMDVKLTGSMSSKRLIVQPANVMMTGAIAATPGSTSSYFVFSKVRLVR